MEKFWNLPRECRTIAALGALGSALLGGCSSEPSAEDGVAGMAAPASAGASVAGGGGATNAISGSPGSSSAGSSGMLAAFSGGGSGSEAGSLSVAGTGGIAAGAGSSAGRGGSAGAGGVVAASAGAGGLVATGGSLPGNCNLANPVSFQKDIQGFLAGSCGKGVSSGCHVTDSNKTNLGYNHAYDWITAVAHTGSCGKTPPYAKRFEVVMAVIDAAKPASCPNSRKMPPPDASAPALTACNIAALQAWLAEPQVLQMHVTVSDETASLYPAGPYLMPPFN